MVLFPFPLRSFCHANMHFYFIKQPARLFNLSIMFTFCGLDILVLRMHSQNVGVNPKKLVVFQIIPIFLPIQCKIFADLTVYINIAFSVLKFTCLPHTK